MLRRVTEEEAITSVTLGGDQSRIAMEGSPQETQNTLVLI